MTTRMPLEVQEFTVSVSPSIGNVEALLLRPTDARRLLVLAHGAGAGMHHPFMERLARELAAYKVATFRYEFPFMQQRRKRPDAPAVLTATVLAAIATAAEAEPDLPLFAGGKSLGGRMTSFALSGQSSGGQAAIKRVQGLVFLGFPLHPPGRPGVHRADHLEQVTVPMLFLQGTRDALADLELVRPLCARLAPRATLHIVESADHSFHVLKRSGTNDAEVLQGLARTVASWAESLT